jgi:hypothetical protein
MIEPPSDDDPSRNCVYADADVWSLEAVTFSDSNVFLIFHNITLPSLLPVAIIGAVG